MTLCRSISRIPPLPAPFVARWCVGTNVEPAGGVFQVREDEPEPRVEAGLHRTPYAR
jgi:hypothetical protein